MFCGAVAAALTLLPNAAACLLPGCRLHRHDGGLRFLVLNCARPELVPGLWVAAAVGRALQLLNLMAKYLPSAGALCKVFHCQSANLLFCGSTIEILWLPGMPAN